MLLGEQQAGDANIRDGPKAAPRSLRLRMANSTRN
jgi:hypothetical protein